MITQYGPGDPETWSKQPDDDTVEQPIEPLTDEEFIPEVWNYLVQHSPAIDEFILNLREDLSLSNHRWLPSLREIKEAVMKVTDEKHRK